MKQKTMSLPQWGELFLLSAIWGGVFISIRISLDEIGPITAVTHRVGWAAIALWGVVILRKVPVVISRRVFIGFVGMGFLNNAIPFTLQAWGQLYVESGLVGILNAGTAVWGVLVAALLLSDERLTINKTIGVILGFGGVVMAIGFDNFYSFDARSIAQLAVIAATVSYAFAGVWGRKMLAGLSPIYASAGMLTASCAMVLPLAITMEGPLSLSLSLPTFMAIAYYSLIATGFAYLLYYRILAGAGSGNLLLCTLLMVPVAILLGHFIKDEVLEPKVFAGFALLGGGILMLSGSLDKMFKFCVHVYYKYRVPKQ